MEENGHIGVSSMVEVKHQNKDSWVSGQLPVKGIRSRHSDIQASWLGIQVETGMIRSQTAPYWKSILNLQQQTQTNICEHCQSHRSHFATIMSFMCSIALTKSLS